MGAPTSQVTPMAPHELSERLARDASLLLVDVRDRWEYDIAALDGATLVPLSEFAERSSELPRDRPIVVYCHHGVRSLAAAQFLVTRGFAHVFNLTGGIDRYALDVDSRIPRY